MESSVAWSRRTEKCTSKSFLQKVYATFVGEGPWLIFDLAFIPISALGHLGLTSTEKWKNLLEEGKDDKDVEKEIGKQMPDDLAIKRAKKIIKKLNKDADSVSS